MANEDQIDEIEALRAIYDADMTEISPDPPCFMIRVTNIVVDLGGPVSLKFTLPTLYPNAHPKIELPMRTRYIPTDQIDEILSVSHKCAEENLGMPMVYTIVDTVQQWINDNVTSRTEENETEEPKEDNEKSLESNLTHVHLEEPKSTGGRWDYVIGLVGKPSAGKSTFFNAATTHDTAKTGSHPFTTIEPNIGKAFYSIPCPCQGRQYTCDAAFGHDYKGNRYIPVLLKDVAGLVPGASEGKGRGNRFLNDLLDADVLIHIIDVSGTTNEKGEEAQDYDPANDVRWLQQELHQWIYQNIFNKWDAIQRKPSKLIDMFTGYHANRALIHSALHNAGIGEKELAAVATWDETVLHRIVTSFLCLRFPMLLALNKADKRKSSDNIERLKSEMPDANIIAVSAKTECKLQKMKTDGLIKYELGSNKLEVFNSDIADDVTKRFIAEVSSSILDRFESTNVHSALCQAVTLREPTYAFPVRCLDTLNSIRKHYGRDQDTLLRDCISLKPGSKVEDLYNVLCHYPVSLLTGDFVRAETLITSGEKRPARKDEKIEKANSIIKLMTTKRSS